MTLSLSPLSALNVTRTVSEPVFAENTPAYEVPYPRDRLFNIGMFNFQCYCQKFREGAPSRKVNGMRNGEAMQAIKE